VRKTDLISIGSRLCSGGSRWRNLASVLELLQGLGASTVALAVDAASAEWEWHAQARNVVVARESTAVVQAEALRLLLHAGLHGDAKVVALVAQAQQVLLGKVGNGETGLASNVLLGEAQAGAHGVNSEALRPLAVARLEVTAVGSAWNDIGRLGGRVAGGGLGDVQRNVEVSLLHRAAKNYFAAEALAIDLAVSNRHHKLASTSGADEACLLLALKELANLRFVLDTQALGGGLKTPAVLELEVGAAESAASHYDEIIGKRRSLA